MTVRVDMDRKTVSLAVRDLAEDPTGSEEGTETFYMRARAAVGSRLHRDYLAAREAEIQGYLSEQPLRFEDEIDGYRVKVRGRIDGTFRRGETVVIEEVKSVLASRGEMRRIAPADTGAHLRQLEYYLYFTARAHGAPVSGILVLVSIVDDSVLRLEVALDAHRVASAFADRVRAAIAGAAERRGRFEALRRYAPALKFPFPAPRDHQLEMVDAVAGALRDDRKLMVSAPTGIGKTVAALFPALSHALDRGWRLFFLTAKTTQQRLVAETFLMIRSASENGPPVMALTLRAKQKMCPTGQLACRPELCPYLERFAEKIDASGLVERLSRADHLDPDTIYDAAVGLELCPFEVSLALVSHADLVICDYNYVFDPRVSLKRVFEGPDAVPALVVIDEAHNLLERATGYYSPAIVRERVDEVRGMIEAGGFGRPADAALLPGVERALPASERVFDDLASLLAELAEFLDQDGVGEAPGAPDPVVEHGLEKRLVRFQNEEGYSRLLADFERLILNYFLYNRVHRVVRPEDPLLDLFFSFARFVEVLAQGGEEFAHLVVRGREGKRYQIQCLDPSRMLGERLDQLAGVVAMSATLSPADYYRDALGFDREATRFCTLPSPFPPERRRILIVPSVDTTYRRRERHYGRIGQLIGDLASIRPGHYIAFFTSFEFLENVAPFITAPGFEIMRQERHVPEAARARLLDRLERPAPPVLLCAVQGGIFAEGIDLPGERLVGAFVVGPGLPLVSVERELIRRHFDERGGAGFEFAYLYPGMNRAIQAAGRVIRTPDDVGLIVLLDRRFTFPNYARCLPPDWYDESPGELVSRDPARDVREFWSSLEED